MRDHPIIFSSPMVQALLAGRKTQTRRLAYAPAKSEPRGGWWGSMFGRLGWWRPSPWQRVQPGDRLWVRESWCQRVDDYGLVPGAAFYMADGEHVVKKDGDGFTITLPDGREASPWRPSIHMPRWASRLTLHVEAVRVERLQEISEADAEAEGVVMTGKVYAEEADGFGGPWRSLFAGLWNRLHGPDAWEANPEVVALIFRVEQRNIDA